jgi:hypothetical protein
VNDPRQPSTPLHDGLGRHIRLDSVPVEPRTSPQLNLVDYNDWFVREVEKGPCDLEAHTLRCSAIGAPARALSQAVSVHGCTTIAVNANESATPTTSKAMTQ